MSVSVVSDLCGSYSLRQVGFGAQWRLRVRRKGAEAQLGALPWRPGLQWCKAATAQQGEGDPKRDNRERRRNSPAGRRRWGTGGSGAEEGQYYNSWTSRQGNCTAEFTIKIFTVLQNKNSQMKIFSSSVRSLKLLYNTLYPCTHIFMSISI